jgi:methanogenic corrinoid protein MtbC1
MTIPVRLRPEASLTDRYLELVGAGTEREAVTMVLRLLDDGIPAESILLEVIAPAQTRVGQLWAENQWPVAREHAATAISERAVAALSIQAGAEPFRGRVTVACVDGEWHALPVRILTEVLRLRGWHVDFLGPSVPGTHLSLHLQQTDADTVALSCMLATRLPRAHAAILASQANGVPVIAGGPGFGPGGRYARLLGADTWAPRADVAADRLAAPDWPPARVHPVRPAHQPGEEYLRLVDEQPALLEAVLQGLPHADPAVAAFDEPQREAALDGLSQLVDFLAAALYFDDPAPFTQFTAWTARLLAARGIPGYTLTNRIGVCRDLLVGFPAARAVLAGGIDSALDAASRASAGVGAGPPAGKCVRP